MPTASATTDPARTSALAVAGPGGGAAAAAPRRPCASRPTRSRSWSSAPWVARRSSRAASARTRPGRCCCRAAGPGSARRCGRCASARPSCWPWPAATARFPIILETYRECLQDVFDLPALREHPGAPSSGARSDLVSVETRRASPFASSLLFDYIATYMYEGDAPLLDRRAQALALDRDLLRELLGAEELRELLDARRPGRARAGAAGADAGARGRLGRRGARPAAPAGRPDARRRSPRGSAARTRGRASAPPGSGWRRWRPTAARCACASPASALDRGRGRRPLPRRASGVAPPRGRAGGVPGARRATRWRGCWRAGRATTARSWPTEPAARWGLPVGVVEPALERLMAGGHAAARRVPARRRRARVVRPGGPAAAAPPLAGPAAPRGRAGRAARAGALPARAGRASASGAAGIDRLAEVIAQLEGLPLPASVLERDDPAGARAAATCRGCSMSWAPPARSCWVGHGSLGRDDGRDRALPAGPPGPAAAGRRRRPTLPTPRRPTLAARRPARRSWRAAAPSLLSRPAGGRAAAAAAGRGPPGPGRARPARRALGPGLGGRRDQRHVRAAAGAALAARRARPRGERGRDSGASRGCGPPEAAGRWSLVARRASRRAVALAGGAPTANRAPPRAGACACSSATAS